MTTRVFFCAGDVRVSSQSITVCGRTYPLEQLNGARSRRVGRWFWETYEVIVSRRVEGEFTLLRHRNAFFAYQLVRAIEMALREQSQTDRVTALTA